MKKFLFFLVLSALPGAVSAQNLSYDFYSFRNGNMFNVNPAYCSRDEGINVIMNAQSQNPGVSYANKNFMAGAYSRIGGSQGLGVKLISDTRGAFQVLKADVSYSYVANFTGGHKLSMGLAGGIFNSNMAANRIDNYEMLDHTDPTLTDNQFNSTQFTAGAGLLYQYKDLEASLSAPHMITTSMPFISHLNLAVFYSKKVNDDIKLQPWIYYQNMPVTKNVTGVLVKGTYRELVWLQAGYQTNKSILASFGIKVENIGISYGFRSSNKDFREVASGTHEVVLSVQIGTKSSKRGSKTTFVEFDDIISRLDKLLSKTITPESKAEIRLELEKLKEQLKTLESSNSDPEKAKKIGEQLQIIEQKILTIEKRLADE